MAPVLALSFLDRSPIGWPGQNFITALEAPLPLATMRPASTRRDRSAEGLAPGGSEAGHVTYTAGQTRPNTTRMPGCVNPAWPSRTEFGGSGSAALPPRPDEARGVAALLLDR